MKKIFSLLLAVLSVFTFVIPVGAKAQKELTFNADGEFTVLQISDPQDDQYIAYELVHFIDLAIKETNPDLIVFTGDIVEDNIDGKDGVDEEDGREGVVVEGDYEKTLANVKAVCDAVFSSAEKGDIPFAVAQGNNDYKSTVTAEDWLKIYASYENCLVSDESEDSSSRIDYNLEIKSSDGKTAFNIWIMDTGADTVTKEQIEWYKAESNKLKNSNSGEIVPSILFQHIQTDDVGNLFEECESWHKNARQKGGKYYRLNSDVAEGYFKNVSFPGFTSNQFRAWKEQGDVLGAYFGHQHQDGYTGTYDSIELGLTYGCQFAKDGPYGIRVFTFYEDNIKEYSNDLYTYEGSALKGNARFELQTNESGFEKFLDKAEAFIAKVYVVIKMIWSCIVEIKNFLNAMR